MAKTKSAAAAKKQTRPKNDPLTRLDRTRLGVAHQRLLRNVAELQDLLEVNESKQDTAEDLALMAEDLATSSAVLADVSAKTLLTPAADEPAPDRSEE